MKKEKAKAMADLDEFVRLQSSSAESLCARGEALLFFGDEKGVADFDAALESEPAYAPGYLARGKARHSRGEFGEAISDFDHALLLLPKSVEGRMGRAEVLQDMNQFHKALADLGEAIRLLPSDSLLHTSRGTVYIELHELEKALIDAETAIAIDPANHWSYLIRGDVARARAEYAVALAEYDRATELSPGDAYPYVRRAEFLSECPSPQFRDCPRAIRDATRACELTEWKVPAYLSSLAACYAESGDFKEAVKWQTKALESASGEWKSRHSVILRHFRSKKTIRQLQVDWQSTHSNP